MDLFDTTFYGSETFKSAFQREYEARRLFKKSLNVYLGIDPTFTSLTLGHLVPLVCLEKFSGTDNCTLILGDFTARLGDPSGRVSERTALDVAVVQNNAALLEKQLHKMFPSNEISIKFNATWLESLNTSKLLEYMSLFTAQDFLAKEGFRQRFDKGNGIHLSEFIYPILQGYDALHLDADVQIGGSDQLFNMLVGRKLQEKYGQLPQIPFCLPLLTGTDGIQKMSKSLGNCIYLSDEPKDMYLKVMRLPDSLLSEYYALLLYKEYALSENPMKDKKRLAFEIVRLVHGLDSALEAEEFFEKTVQQKLMPEEMRTVVFSKPTPVQDVLIQSNIVNSKAKARALLAAGAVKIDSITATDYNIVIDKSVVLKVGKQWRKIEILEN